MVGQSVCRLVNRYSQLVWSVSRYVGWYGRSIGIVSWYGRSVGMSVGMVGQSVCRLVWSVNRYSQLVWSVSRYVGWYGRSIGIVSWYGWSVGMSVGRYVAWYGRLVWSVWWSGSVVSVGSAQALAILPSTWVGLESVAPDSTYHLKGGIDLDCSLMATREWLSLILTSSCTSRLERWEVGGRW